MGSAALSLFIPRVSGQVGSGHNILATMFEQARAMYRAGGPEELRSLGETEFVPASPR